MFRHRKRAYSKPGLGLAGTLMAIAAVAAALLVPTIGSAQTQTAPVNTGEPQISGSAVQGQQLSATTGTWANNPTSFAFQWLRCPSDGGSGDGSNCAPIALATSSSYTATANDVGFTIRVLVTASNIDGSASAASNATAVVQAALTAPVNIAEPQISGSADPGPDAARARPAPGRTTRPASPSSGSAVRRAAATATAPAVP